MQRWEYMTLPLPEEVDDLPTIWETSLNVHGQQGWELVTIKARMNGVLHAFLKRPIAGD